MIPSTSELLIIGGVALLLFGPNNLPKLGSAVGEAIRNFKKGMKPLDETPNQPSTVNQEKTLLAQHSSVSQSQELSSPLIKTSSHTEIQS